MKKRMRQYLGPLCVSTFGLLVGCAGEGVGFNDSALGQDANSQLVLGDVAPLATIEVERWESAFAGCEGLLDTVQEYGVAEGQPELVVGMDVERDIVCVDTYTSIENELAMRSIDDVDALWLGYVAALQTLEADHTGMDPHSGAEPEPQTNMPGEGEEPEPQTNTPGEGEEPEPQTNLGAAPEPQTNDGSGDCVDETVVAPIIDLDVISGTPDADLLADGTFDVDLHESDSP